MNMFCPQALRQGISGLGFITLAGLPVWAGGNVDSTNARPWTVGVDVDTVSRYVWRGLAFSEGWAAQPSMSVAAYDFKLGWWNNYDLGEKTTPQRWNETDLTLTYARELGHWNVEAGVQSFLYPAPGASPDTAEAVTRLEYAVGPVALWTRHSFDLASYPGSYFGEAGLGWEPALHPALALEVGVLLGWGSSRFNEAYVGRAHGALNQAEVDLALRWQFAPRWCARPHVSFSRLLDGSLRRQVDEPDLIWGGLAVSFEY
jgi:hypothetical protein